MEQYNLNEWIDYNKSTLFLPYYNIQATRIYYQLVSYSGMYFTVYYDQTGNWGQAHNGGVILIDYSFLSKPKEVLAFTMSHEWGHEALGHEANIYNPNGNVLQFLKLPTEDEDSADAYAGRFLAYMGYDVQPVVDFLKNIPVIPSDENHSSGMKRASTVLSAYNSVMNYYVSLVDSVKQRNARKYYSLQANYEHQNALDYLTVEGNPVFNWDPNPAHPIVDYEITYRNNSGCEIRGDITVFTGQKDTLLRPGDINYFDPFVSTTHHVRIKPGGTTTIKGELYWYPLRERISQITTFFFPRKDRWPFLANVHFKPGSKCSEGTLPFISATKILLSDSNALFRNYSLKGKVPGKHPKGTRFSSLLISGFSSCTVRSKNVGQYIATKSLSDTSTYYTAYVNYRDSLRAYLAGDTNFYVSDSSKYYYTIARKDDRLNFSINLSAWKLGRITYIVIYHPQE